MSDLTERLYQAIVLDFEGRGEAWTTHDSGDTLARAAAEVSERELRNYSQEAVRLAQHLASEGSMVGGRCDLVASPSEAESNSDRGRCRNDVVAVKWEDGFADWVCEAHAFNAKQRGALVVYPKRHDGGV